MSRADLMTTFSADVVSKVGMGWRWELAGRVEWPAAVKKLVLVAGLKMVCSKSMYCFVLTARFFVLLKEVDESVKTITSHDHNLASDEIL